MSKRIPVLIEFGKLQILSKTTILTEVNKLDYHGKVDIYGNRIVTLKTTAKKIVAGVLKDYAAVSIELFGKEDYSELEQADFAYLKSLVE